MKEIFKNYKFEIKWKNLSVTHFNLNIRPQFRLRRVIYDISIITKILDGYYGKVPEKDIKNCKRKIKRILQKIAKKYLMELRKKGLKLILY